MERTSELLETRATNTYVKNFKKDIEDKLDNSNLWHND